MKNWTYISTLVTATSRYGLVLVSEVIGSQKKLWMTHIWHNIARYFSYHIWDVRLCGIHNFRQRYTSALLIVSTFHSVKRCKRPFLSLSSSNRWRYWDIVLVQLHQLPWLNCLKITLGIWHWISLRPWIQVPRILTRITNTFVHMLSTLQYLFFQLCQINSQEIC